MHPTFCTYLLTNSLETAVEFGAHSPFPIISYMVEC